MGQPLTQIDLYPERCFPRFFGQGSTIDVNLDFFKIDFFMICDRSDCERYSTSECSDNQLDGTAIDAILRVTACNRKRLFSNIDFSPSCCISYP